MEEKMMPDNQNLEVQNQQAKVGDNKIIYQAGIFNPQENKDESVTAKICKGVALFYMVTVAIFCLYWADKTENWSIFFAGSIGGLFTGMILWGIGEIIRLLHEKL